MTDKEAMAKELEELAGRFSEGWHEGIKIDASDIMLLCQAAKALAQPEQEPVAWIHNFIEGGISIGKRPSDLNRHPDRWTALYKDPKPCPTCEALCRTVMLDQTSHDTTPPQRTEQEPVAWMWDVNNGGGYTTRDVGLYQTAIPFAKHTPLYITPPQRTEPLIGCVNHDCDKCREKNT
jgi:hypothetical protein